MPATVRHNIITFKPTGSAERVALQLTGPMTIRGGLEPDVVSAVVTCVEFAKLGSSLYLRSGAIEFWSTHAPGDTVIDEEEEEVDAEPDFIRDNFLLVDVSIADFGRLPGEATLKAVVYQLSFADHRYGFRAPRGGRLTQGWGNPDPKRNATLISNEALCEACLHAMGVTTGAAATMSDYPPMRDLQWFGAHAPTELQRLLEYTSHVYCPLAGGSGIVQQLGTGGLPSPGGGETSTDISQTVIPRLGQEVVLISEGQAKVRTFNHSASTGATSFKFVVQDPDDEMKWKLLADVSALGGDPAAELKKGLRSVAQAKRDLLLEQLYRCIQLQTGDTVQGPVLDRVIYPDGKDDDIHIVATIATREKNGAWINREVRINGAADVDNVLQFPARLGTVDGDERSDLDPFFAPLAESALKPAVSFETFTSGKRVYAVYGFYRDGGVVTAMDSATATSRLSGFWPATAIYSVPELRFVSLNNSTDNGTELATQAASFAASLVVADVPEGRVLTVRGFYPAEINGRVSEIQYDQAAPSTTITIDGWQIPGGVVRGGRAGSRVGPSPRSVPVERSNAFASLQRSERGLRPVFAQTVAAISGKVGRYTGKTYSGNYATAASGNFAASNLGTLAAAVDCEIWYAPEGVSGVHSLPAGRTVVGFAGDVGDDGKLIVVAIYPLRDEFPVKCTVDGGDVGDEESTCDLTYTVKDLAGATLATEVLPLTPREPNVEYVSPGADSYGTAFIDGGLKLVKVHAEVPLYEEGCAPEEEE